ncbi:MAG: DUF2007 domain-containing protein [Pseudomonadota bacterium]
MKLAYTNANRMMVLNVQNLLEREGIKTLLRNEYAVGAMGEISPFEVWLEVWVFNQADYNRARTLVSTSISDSHAPEWLCHECGERNDPSFDFCWNCQTDARASRS